MRWRAERHRPLSERTDGGFRGRHDFMKLVLARKVAAGVVVDDAMASYSRDFQKMR